MRRRVLLAFVALGVIWGSNFIFMKWAAETITPQQITLLRVLFGLLPVLAYGAVRNVFRREHLRHAHHFLVMSVLATSLYYFAYAAGTARLPSGIAGALSGAIPLFTFLAAALFLRSERITALRLFGVLVGFSGVVLIARPWEAVDAVDPTGVGLMLLGSASVGLSFVYAKRFLSGLAIPAAALTTYQMGLGLLSLLALTRFDGITAPPSVAGIPHRAATASLIRGVEDRHRRQDPTSRNVPAAVVSMDCRMADVGNWMLGRRCDLRLPSS